MADDDILFQIDAKAIIWDALGEIQHFARDQLPYAQAAALYGVGLDARKAMVNELRKKFTIRTKGKPWAERALYVWPHKASLIKRDIVEGKGGFITVATRDNLGKLLTDGGTKTYKGRDKDNLGFGVPFLGTGRKNANTIIKPGRNSPRDIIQKKGGFLVKTKSGKQLLIMPPKKYRKTKGTKNEAKRMEIQKAQRKVMFVMKHEVKIKPWWDLREVLGKAMLEWLPKRFVEAANHAMKTRKRK